MIEQEKRLQKSRLQRARDVIDHFLKAYEEVPSVEPIE